VDWLLRGSDRMAAQGCGVLGVVVGWRGWDMGVPRPRHLIERRGNAQGAGAAITKRS
jgi:hypothetical protein